MTDLNEQERIARAHNAKRALEEFFDPAFATVTEEYDHRLRAICAAKPWATNEIAALANAGRIVEEVKKQIVAIIIDGEMAKTDTKRADRIAALSPKQRRLLNIGQY